MAAGYIIGYGSLGTNPNTLGADLYGVVDGTGTIAADGDNNADLVDLAAFFPFTPTGRVQAVELEATVQAQQPDRNFAILVVNRVTTTTDPATVNVMIEP